MALVKRFKQKGEDAIMDGLGKLHNMHTFIPVNKSNMSKEEEQRVIESLMFLKEKRKKETRQYEGADGEKQHETAVKGEATSLKVCIKSIFITEAVVVHNDEMWPQ